ncbi:hypothetical protein M514_13293 [Trichuris suis]|uniref:EGF-like domain-containing protein n=1 Tax=Trichuris suis TaxID=68888 RepID=A0A085MRI8_9BILA|nr:hypothetical protein M514_13293 [Trichuris suis]
MPSTYWHTIFIVIIAIPCCHSYPELNSYDKNDCFYYFWRHEHRIDFPMAVVDGSYVLVPYAKYFTPLTLCGRMTPEGRTIGFLWPTGMRTLCSSDKALEHIWSQTKSTTNKSTDERLYDIVRPERRRVQRGMYELLVNGYVIVKINCTQTGNECNVAYKQLESENISVIRHVVEGNVVVKPDLALFYNFTDLEHSSKQYLGAGERIIVILSNDMLYYIHESKLEEFIEMCRRAAISRKRGWMSYHSMCSYSNYMKYCADKPAYDIRPRSVTLWLLLTSLRTISAHAVLLFQSMVVGDADKGSLAYTATLSVLSFLMADRYSEIQGREQRHTIVPLAMPTRLAADRGSEHAEKLSNDFCPTDVDECAQRNAVRGYYTTFTIDPSEENFISRYWWIPFTYQNGINNCSIHSKCENTFGSYKCICHDGWRGIHCDEDIEECKNNPCRHGGLCMETYGGYTCQCPPGWNGHNCEKDIDECTSSPCQNQGECTNTDGSFKCKCSAYFTGQTCETEIDACKSLECKHGFCTGKGKNAQCQCYGHWMGAKCNETVNMCKKEDTCMNGGACIIDRLMNFTCQCTTGFTGKNCEIDQNDCGSNPCMQGWCVDLVGGGYKCICHPGMEGDNCTKRENECGRLDCVGGTCKLHNGVPYCKCDEYHFGVHCEIEIDPCISSPCSAGAICINDLKNKGFICVCPEGYEGFDCKQKKAFCTAESCFNNGTCSLSNSPLGYECLCNSNTTGRRCEMLIMSSGQAKCVRTSTFSLILVIWAVGKTLWVSLASLSDRYHSCCNY